MHFSSPTYTMVAMRPLPISLCYIVRNEEEYLRASIESAVNWVSELVVLDSGSTDKTQEIAYSFSSKVKKFLWKQTEWKNDFSSARNYAAHFAREPWILFLDGDEILDADAAAKIALAIAEPVEVACFSLTQRNYTTNSSLENAKRAEFSPVTFSAPLFYVENWMERLYQRDLGLRYEGRIHESLLPSAERLGLKHARLPVVLHHYGRLKAQTAQKLQYYLELTEQKWKEDQQNPVAWIELAINLMEVGQTQKAFVVASQAAQKFPREPEVIRAAFQTALRLDRFDLAEKWIETFLDLRPNDLYARSQLTTALLYQGKFEAVFKAAENVFGENPNDFVANLNCAVIYFEMKNWANASRHLQIALKEKPEDTFVIDALKKVEAQLQKH